MENAQKHEPTCYQRGYRDRKYAHEKLLPFEKCKLKPQGNITEQISEWLTVKGVITLSVDKDAKK